MIIFQYKLTTLCSIFSNMNHLRLCPLEGYYNRIDWNPLLWLPNLTNLDIKPSQRRDSHGIYIDKLPYLTSLKFLYLFYTPYDQAHLTDIATLTNLKGLTMRIQHTSCRLHILPSYTFHLPLILLLSVHFTIYKNFVSLKNIFTLKYNFELSYTFSTPFYVS